MMEHAIRPPSFGVSLPQSFQPGRAWLGELSDFFHRAEDGGIGSVWMQEQLVGRDPSFEPLVALAFAAAKTQNMMLGTSTVVASLRSPMLFAKQVATLDQLSHGRVVLGLSIGGDDPRIFDAAGVAVRERLPRMLETLAATRTLWTQSAPSFQGTFTNFDDASMEPKPVQQPHPPVWFGGDVDAALDRAAQLGSGWIGSGASSTGAFAQRVQHVERALEDANKLRSEFTIAKKVYLAIDEDPRRAQTELERWFVQHWPANMHPVRKCREAAAFGTVDDVAAHVDEVVRAGADLVILNPVFSEFRQLHWLIEIAQRAGAAAHDRTSTGGR